MRTLKSVHTNCVLHCTETCAELRWLCSEHVDEDVGIIWNKML